MCVCVCVCVHFLPQVLPLDQVGDMLQPSVDATAWQMEVERVLPHLKVTIRSDHRVRQGGKERRRKAGV